jgi:hypothetical protein
MQENLPDHDKIKKSVVSGETNRPSRNSRLDWKQVGQELCDSLNRGARKAHAEDVARALFEKLNEPIRSKRAPLYRSNRTFFESFPDFDTDNSKLERL